MEKCNHSLRCNRSCYCIDMVSVTSALRYVTLASHESRSSMYIRGLIQRNWPRQFRLSGICLNQLPMSMHDKTCVIPMFFSVYTLLWYPLYLCPEVIKLEYILKLKIKRKDWLLVEMCP